MSYAQRFLEKVKLHEKDEVSPVDERQYQELIKTLREKSYPDAVEYIDEIVKDPKLKFLLSLGFGGPLADVKLTTDVTDIPVVNLLPTQNEIGLNESLKYILDGKEDLYRFFDTDTVTIKTPIVVFNSTFIIDGHHRWSQAYCTNPKLSISAINIKGRLSPIQILKAVQATIGSNIGQIPSSDRQGSNMYACSEAEIHDYIMKTMSSKSERELSDILKTDKNGVADFITKNCMELKINNTPIMDAPTRDAMPKTKKDPSLFSDLEAGVTKI